MSAPTMASPPPLDGHSAMRTPSDYGYQPVFSAPDLAIRQAVDSVRTEWTDQFNQLQAYTRLLEAQLQQMSDSQKALQTQMMQMVLMCQQQQQQPQLQPQRRQGRPHPGKSMRAEKRRRKQALLEQANSTSDGASDADGPMAAAAASPAAPKAALPPPAATSSSPPLAAGPAAEAAAPEAGGQPPELELPAAATEEATKASLAPAPAGSPFLDATTPAPPVAQSQQIAEGWFHVAAQVESSATSSQTGTPRQVLAPSLTEANRALAKAAAEEACAKLLEAMKQQHIEQICSTNEALSAFKAEIMQQLRSHEQSTDEVLCSIPSKEDLVTTCDGLKQHMQHARQDLGHHLADEIQALKQQRAEEAVAAQQAFKDQLAAFKEEMLQEMRSEQQRGVEALKEERRQEAADILAALTASLAPLATLQSQHQSDFEQLRRELQEVQRKNEELHADSARHIRHLNNEFAAMQPQIAELMDKITELTTVSLQGSSQQPPQSQQSPEAAVVITDAGADELGAQDLSPPPGLSVAPAADQQTPSPLPAEEVVSEATVVTAAASASLTALAPRTPPRCRVVACEWYKEYNWNGWKLWKEKELAEPFLVTATTLGDVKVKATKALNRNMRDDFRKLKNFDGSRCLPSQDQEERRSLQDLGCGEGSLLKLHFRRDYTRGLVNCHWWSYEVTVCNSH